MPSSNHLIDTSPAKLVFLILVGGFIQAMRRACSAQNAVRVARGALEHVLVARGVDMRLRGDLGPDGKDLSVGRHGASGMNVFLPFVRPRGRHPPARIWCRP